MLTEHFTLAEATFSHTAVRLGIDNAPADDNIVRNLRRTAEFLERVRAVLGAPILVSSWYRCLALNAAVRGARNSQHLAGLAVDFTAPRFGAPADICRAILAAALPFDQLIHEGAWVHVSIPDVCHAPRHDVLTARFGGGVTYQRGIA